MGLYIPVKVVLSAALAGEDVLGLTPVGGGSVVIQTSHDEPSSGPARVFPSYDGEGISLIYGLQL